MVGEVWKVYSKSNQNYNCELHYDMMRRNDHIDQFLTEFEDEYLKEGSNPDEVPRRGGHVDSYQKLIISKTVPATLIYLSLN
jgi:hypothetical protein